MKAPSFLRRLLTAAGERGQTLTEYGLVASLVIVFILVVALQVMGTNIADAFQKAAVAFP